MPLGWIIGITKDRLEDTDHAGGQITATRLLTCPRQTLIEDFVRPLAEDPDFGLVFDPTRFNSARFGTAVHADIAANTPGGYKEIRFPMEGQEPTVLDVGAGVTCAVAGRIDFISPDTITVEDYKTHSETAHKFKYNAKAGKDAELRVQYSIYKALVEASVPGIKIEKGRVWHGAMTSAKHPAPPWFDREVEFMPLVQCGEIRPYGSKYKVREIIRMYQWALGEIGKIEAPMYSAQWYGVFTEIIRGVPMVGETMFGGEKCLTYCGPAQEFCFYTAERRMRVA